MESSTTLQHYGLPRRSGRYKWGSGEDPYHHGADSPKHAKVTKPRTGNPMVDKMSYKTLKSINKAKTKVAKLESKRQKKEHKAAYEAEQKRIKEEYKAAKKGKQQLQRKGSEDYQQTHNIKAKSMSDQELAAAINRLRLEKQYLELTAKPQSQKKDGRVKRFVNNAMDELVKQTAQGVGDVGGQYIKYKLGSAINKQVGKDVISWKKKEKK